MEEGMSLSALANMGSSDIYIFIGMGIFMFVSYKLAYFTAHMMEVTGFLPVPPDRIK